MAYIRFDDDSDFYIWAGGNHEQNTLDIWHVDGAQIQFRTGDTKYRKAAIALLRALQDHLQSDGYELVFDKRSGHVEARRKRKD